MQIHVRLFFKQRDRGYAAMAMVAVLGISALFSLMFVFRGAMRSHESQVRNQVKVDYRQKEDALLRALVSIVPNKAIGAMMPDSASSPEIYSWDTILAEAIDMSNADGALNSAVVSNFGIAGVINANTGDMNLTDSSQIVGVISGEGTVVGPGNTANTGLLSNSDVNIQLPPPLDYVGSFSQDIDYPIISTNKTYPSSTPGLGASANPNTGWNKYNIIDYPDIRFGLTSQDGKFVAKRNWWAFSLTFGGGGTGPTAMPLVKKNYVLSIYEVPEQMALSAAGKLQVGTFEGGANWQNTTIEGGIYAGEVDAKGLDLLGSDSRVSARKSIKLNGGGTVGGVSISEGFDMLGVRETRWAGTGTDFYKASVASDSGRVAILPLSQGNQFIQRTGAVPRTNTISDTGWYEYAMGALQCKMKIEVTAQQTNRPVAVRFTCQQGSGTVVRDYIAGGNWTNHDGDIPSDGIATKIPFYWENIGVGKESLVINLGKISAYLDSLGISAVDREKNNSLLITADTMDPSVTLPDVSNGSADDMGVVFKDCADLTSFTKGLSIVTDYRVYFAENFNQVPQPGLSVPSNAGLPAGQAFFPPVSVFAASKRYGTVLAPVDSVLVEGQLTSIQADDGTTVNPLDLKTNSQTVAGENIGASNISADLSQIVSPAQLPPINRMSWLVTVEELHGTSSTVLADDGNNGGGNDPGGTDPSNPGNGNNGNSGN